MQSKTASILLITGTSSIFISVIISLFFTVYEDEIRTQTFNMLQLVYFVQEIVITATTILFAVSYYKSGFSKMKLPAILFLVSGVLSFAYFLILHYKYTIRYELSEPQTLVNNFLWLSTSATDIILAVHLLRNRKNLNAIAWVIFLMGAIFITQCIPGIYRQVSFFLDDADFITTALKIKALLFYIGLCAPVGFLLVAQRTEYNNRAILPEENEFSNENFKNNHDLLDISMEEKSTAATQENKGYHSVLWWMLTLVISSIPVIGLGFLIYWSIARSEVKRGNWAVATIIMTMVSSLFIVFYYMDLVSGRLGSSYFGYILIGIILFFGAIAVICGVYNNRNQENIALENYSYSPTVTGWIGYSLLMGIPLVNLICLIVFAADYKDHFRRTWAQARLLMIPFAFINILFFSDILEFILEFL